MTAKNSPLNYTSIELEIEAIKRFRSLAHFLDKNVVFFANLMVLEP